MTPIKPNGVIFEGRRDFSLCVFKNRLWVLGGANGLHYLNDIWSSVDGSTWVEESHGATWQPRCGHSVTPFRGRLILVGGTCSTIVSRGDFGVSLQRPISVAWSSKDGIVWHEIINFPVLQIFNSASIEFNGKLFILGGNTGKGVTSIVMYSDNAVDWNKYEAPWTPREGHQVFQCNNKLFIVGGSNSAGKTMNETWFSEDGQSWHVMTRASSQVNRAFFASEVYKNKVLVHGGLNGSLITQKDMLSSNDMEDWGVIMDGHMLGGRDGHAMKKFGDALYLLGGNESAQHDLVWMFDGNQWKAQGVKVIRKH